MGIIANGKLVKEGLNPVGIFQRAIQAADDNPICQGILGGLLLRQLFQRDKTMGVFVGDG